MGSALKNIDGFAGLRSERLNRPLLRAADTLHWRDATLRGASRAGARLRALGAALLGRQRANAAVAADVVKFWPPLAAAETRRPRTLRVLHVVDGAGGDGAAAAGSSVGRMVISGRMADVCAELDRLAAASEARQPRHR